ncbi:permease-like cell division protein FtsX [Risungbinella massiliensis]|uniref:permease-like cell division protein FtsX n=1 Tax=Risungbinella massiliensis TaxID=1329796 RepID=UPI0005CB870D|nr:permease-like cell division protein FtsX [Risungbinella massiliensis]
MKIETMLRHLREAYRGVVKNSWMSFASIGTVAVTLLMFGVFMIFAFNLSYLTKAIDSSLSIRVALKPDLPQEKQQALTEEIKKLDKAQADSVEFVPKEKGIQEFKSSFGDDEFVQDLQAGDNNPLPDLIKVLPKDVKDMDALTDEIAKMDGVMEAKPGLVQQAFFSFSGMANNIILIFGLVFAILSSFLISNTIKLTIIARRREIEVMRLVGASNWFIRWPFFIEGAFIGFTGAIFPMGILLIGYQAVYNLLNEGQAISILPMMDVGTLSIYLIASMLLLGATIGIVGSILSVRRFLKV